MSQAEILETKDFECPNCKHHTEITVKKKPSKLIMEEQQTNIITETVKPVEKIIEKEKVIDKVPSHIPAYKCKNCGDNHKNKNYTQRPKGKCTNCGQFAKDESGSCPWCNQEVQPIDENELEDLGIPSPEAVEHMHEGE